MSPSVLTKLERPTCACVGVSTCPPEQVTPAQQVLQFLCSDSISVIDPKFYIYIYCIYEYLFFYYTPFSYLYVHLKMSLHIL